MHVYLRAVISLDEEPRHTVLKRIVSRVSVDIHCHAAQLTLREAALLPKLESWTSLKSKVTFTKQLQPYWNYQFLIFSFIFHICYRAKLRVQTVSWKVSLKSQMLCWILVLYHLTLRNTLTRRVNKAIKNRKDSVKIFIFQHIIHTSFILIKTCSKTNSSREE